MNECIICGTNNVKEIVRNKLSMLECQMCNLVWRQEFDVETSHYKNKEIGLGKTKLDARIRNVKDRIKLIKKYIEPNNLCDIGTGEGVFLLELKKQGYKNIIGIEPNKKAVFFAKSRGLKVFEASLDKIPDIIIRDNNIHTITLFHVIEHLENPRKALEMIYNNLSIGDYLIIETPNDKAYSFLKAKYEHPLIYQEHLFYFDTKNLILLLESIGFKIQAKGKRGFNQHNMSIQKSLCCLGVSKPSLPSTENNCCEKINIPENESIRNSITRILVRKALNLLVVFLGRVDYQWVIARK